MAGATRRSRLDSQRSQRDRRGTAEGGRSVARHPQINPRSIDIAWASIADGDILPGELVYNDDDVTLVYRKGDLIIRFDPDANRSI